MKAENVAGFEGPAPHIRNISACPWDCLASPECLLKDGCVGTSAVAHRYPEKADVDARRPP